MDARSIKKLILAINNVNVESGESITSDPINTFDYIYTGLFIQVAAGDGGGSGTLDVKVQVSPDQGQNWFDLIDNLAGDPEIPGNYAYGGIAMPGAFSRVIVTGGDDLEGSYNVSVWFMNYR